MIVRNSSDTLKACLESVRGVVSEIVIADTGSTDTTKQIAQESGGRIIDIPWANDFAAARNLSLAEVKADWVLVLDADEMLDSRAAAAIPPLLASQGVAGYQVTIRNYVLSLGDRIWDRPAKPNDGALAVASAYPAFVEHENVRLFRRDPQIYFVGRVHESVGPRIEQCGLHLDFATFVIHHFGLAGDAETRARKNRFYHELGKLKVAEMPSNAQAHLELGLVELDNFGNVEEALACFRRAYELSPKFAVAWFFAGIAQFRLGRYRESLDCLRQAEKLGRVTSAVLEAIGDAHYNLEEFRESVKSYERALKLTHDAPSLESKFGLALIRAGQEEKGLAAVRNALQKQPQDPDLHDRLVAALVWLGRTQDAAVAAEGKLRSVPAPSSTDFARSASLWSKSGNWARATAVLHVGLKVFPNDPGLERALKGLEADSGSRVTELVETLSRSS